MHNTLALLSSATGAYVDESRGLIWVTQDDGAILTVPIAGGAPTAVQTVSSPPVAISGNGHTLVIAHRNGTVSTLDPDDPSAPLNSVSRSKSAFGQIALTASAAPTAVVVTRSPATPGRIPLPLARVGGSLTAIKLSTGASSETPVDGITGVAVYRSAAFVARNTLAAKGEVAQLKGSTLTSLVTGLPVVGRLGATSGGDVLLVTHPAAKRITVIRPAAGTVESASTASIPGDVIEVHGLSNNRLAILTSAALVLLTSLKDLRRDPAIDPIVAPIFVGSWVELGFALGDSGLTRNDIRFDVPDGFNAGFVSYTRPNDSLDPVPLLIVGGAVGTHKVVMIEIATSGVLATAEFEITDHWSDQDVGPAGVYTTNASFDGASGWGGGSNSPQNLNSQPHVGSWRSMVLMVDTSSGRWPTDAPTMNANRTAILGHVSNGIPFGADTRSARQYYEENSQFTATPARGLTLSTRSNQTFGPVSLPDAWTDYFEQKKDADGNVVDDRWSSSGGTVQTIISRAISDGVATTTDFSNIDVLIVVVSSPDATGGPPARFVWPHAHSALEFLCGTNAMTDRRSFAYAFVPLDFDVHDGRQMHSTLSHELGHTLGLPDLYDFPAYSADITSRLTGGWDMMAGSRDTLPHYTISNKMRMGWIQAGHLKLYNFQGSSAVAQDITLHAAELGDPPAGRFKAIEIRLGDGWNYYVEYRAEQGPQVTDDLPTDRRVVITDVTSDTFTAPLARPPIVFVRNDIDGDGPLLGNGADLEEKDPGTQMDLRVEVVSTAADNAVVRVSYGSNGKPEPGIRPWNGGPNWQSPDIEVRNDKATADPAHYFNTPWLGHDNTVVAKVKNSGDLLAKGVVVDFFVTEYSAGDGPWVPIGVDTKDIAPNAVVEFTTGWNPDTDGHYCIIVRIRLYQDPGNLAVVDQNIYNNEARSNYTQFVSASASPSTRVGTTVLLANPFDASARVFADVKKTHPQHRVFVSHQWLRVDGKGRQAIQVWDEALWGTREWDLLPGDPQSKRTPTALWEMPNRLSISGWAERPFEADCGALTLTGGVGMRVSAGRATAIRVRAAKRNYVAGQVYFVDNGSGVTTGGTVLIEIRESAGRYFTLTTEVGQDGMFGRDFNNPFGDATRTVEAQYLGAYSAAPCSTGPIPV